MLTLTDTNIASIIGKDTTERRISWRPDDLPSVKIAMRAVRHIEASDSILIDAIMPYWAYLAVLGSLAPKNVLLNTPNFGPVSIPQNKPEAAGRGLTFRTFESESFTLVQFSTPRSLQVEQLSTIIPPTVNPQKGVVISSNAPYWITGTVALAYSGNTAWVACTQRDGCAIVSMSEDRQTPLGTEIDSQTVGEVMQRSSKAGVPKRGQIWVFDDGYGEHPGLIISPDARNEITNDVLVVPFTSSISHAHRHLVIEPSQSGLLKRSYAQYSNISRLGKEQLTKGPIGVLNEATLQEVALHVRMAIGDA